MCGNVYYKLFMFLDIQKEIDNYNETHRSGGKRQYLQLCVGIHWGKSTVGPVGVNKRMDVTVLSDSVNVASRLQELTKLFSTKIVASKLLLENCNGFDDLKMRSLGDVFLRGKGYEIEIVEVYEAMEKEIIREKEQSTDYLAEVFKASDDKDFETAIELLEELIVKFPLDKALLELKTHVESRRYHAESDHDRHLKQFS